MTVDNVKPDGKWQFNDEVADAFDDMLGRSIPQYSVMRQAVTDVGMAFVQPNTWIIDLGCSRGRALEQFCERLGAQNRYMGLEISEPMVKAASAVLGQYPNAIVKSMDLRREYPTIASSLTLSVLTLQFTPIEYRHKIIQQVYDNLTQGGAFILVEKVLGNTAAIDEILVRNYYELKGANGYSSEDIERKRLALEGVLVPVTAHWNEEMLRSAGFRQVDCFWRWMNFAGWVAVKS